MKNKLFVVVLSAAVGISTLFSTEAVAAAKNYLYTSKKPVTKKTIYVGGDSVKLKYNIGGKTKGIKGTWKSDNKGRVTVSKNGSCKAVGNGKATVSFRYKLGKKTYTLRCKFTAETKAGEVNLINSAGTTDDVEVESGSTYRFKSKITPVDEALEINEGIKSTDKVFYQLFADENAETKSNLGTIDNNGIFTAGDKSGTLYVRASAKKSKNSGDNVVSDLIKISITGGSKSDDTKKDDNTSAGNNVNGKPARIELSTNAIVRDMTVQNGVYFADVYFKVIDDKGREITASPDILNDRFSVTWKGDSVSVNEAGKVTLIFPANIPNQPTPIGSSGELKIS